MADTLDITQGTGTTIATDDVGGSHFQEIKLVDGTKDSSTPVAVANGVHGNAMRVTIASDSTGQVQLAAGTAGIGKLTANSGVDIGDVDVTSVPAPLNVVGGGTEAAALRVTMANDSTGLLSVDDNGGSLTIDGTVTASNTSGDIAADSADSGNPVKVGGKAVNMDGTVPGTAVVENDRTNFISDIYGRQLVETSHPNFFDATDNQSSAQTDTELEATPGAGLSLYVTDLVISNGATAGSIKIVEDTASAVDRIESMYFGINGGAAIHFKTPIKLTANKNLGYTSVSVTTHSVTVSGYIAP